MIIPGDQGPVQEEEGLFRMKDIDSADKLKKVADDQQPDAIAEDSDDEESGPKKQKTEKFVREKGQLDKSGLYYKESDSEEAKCQCHKTFFSSSLTASQNGQVFSP